MGNNGNNKNLVPKQQIKNKCKKDDGDPVAKEQVEDDPMADISI